VRCIVTWVPERTGVVVWMYTGWFPWRGLIVWRGVGVVAFAGIVVYEMNNGKCEYNIYP
jgi:hypothetical protein